MIGAFKNRMDDKYGVSLGNCGTKYSAIYCLKAIGAFFVICIHSFEPLFLFPIIRTAVPFFFIISGFFLYRDDLGEAKDKCINAFKRIFWLTLYANIFYYICYDLPSNIFPFNSIRSFIGLFLVGGTFGYHLWYLNAYLEVLLLVIVFIKLNRLYLLWYAIPIGIIWGLMVGKYEFSFSYLPNELLLSRNFFGIGLPCFGIGWFLKKYKCKIDGIIKYPIVLTLIIFVLSELEIFTLKYNGYILRGDYIITTFPLAASMVISGIKYPLLGKGTLLEYIGKNYSTYIYIFHVFIVKVFLIINSQILGLPSVAYPVIIYILTILFIIIWKKCSIKFF